MSYSSHQLMNCHHCEFVQDAQNRNCQFCGQRLHNTQQQSLQHSWAFLFTSIILYFPANFLPIMNTTQFGSQTQSTIAGGVVLLWEHGSYLIAVIIMIASLIVPLAKFIVLLGLCLCEQFKLINLPHEKTTLYRLTEYVGRWSMVDVFVVAFLAAFIQMGTILSIFPGPGALAFAGMVLFSMLTASSLNPKLFWGGYE